MAQLASTQSSQSPCLNLAFSAVNNSPKAMAFVITTLAASKTPRYSALIFSANASRRVYLNERVCLSPSHSYNIIRGRIDYPLDLRSQCLERYLLLSIEAVPIVDTAHSTNRMP